MTKRIHRRRFRDNERHRIFKASKGVCHLCRQPVTLQHYNNHGHSQAWHVDHSRPIADGGTHHPNNLRAAHINCNRAKSDMPVGEFRAKVSAAQAEERKGFWGSVGVGAAVGVLGVALLAVLGRSRS